MALTETENLYNQALDLIGEHRIVEGQTATKQYLACQRNYAFARKEVMSSHLWNEAKTRVIIVQEATGPIFGYDYKYEKPSGCKRIVTINSEPEGWEIEGNYILTDHHKSPIDYSDDSEDYIAGQYLSYSNVTYLVDTSFTSSDWATDLAAYLTSQGGDYDVIHVEYISDLTTITSWPDLLRQCIAHQLAIKVLPNLTNDPKGRLKAALVEEYEKLVAPLARSVDAQQGTLRPYYKSQWLRARR